MDELKVRKMTMGAARPTAFGGKGTKKRTAWEKRSRQSGKNSFKPYISSSLGDMARLMIRQACTENTLGMTEPPPVDFYNFWHKFSDESSTKLPSSYVDPRKVSLPRLQMVTSSFELFSKPPAATSAASIQLGDSSKDLIGSRKDPTHQLAPRISALWSGVRVSMSTESWISSSTKASEPHDAVELGAGWSDGDECGGEDLHFSESDAGDGSSMWNASLRPSAAVAISHRPSSIVSRHASKASTATTAGESAYGDKEAQENKELSAFIALMQMEEAKSGMEGAEAAAKDYFMIDDDDSFLLDAISYGQLPDTAFNTDFDYFNEDVSYFRRKKQEAEKKVQGSGQKKKLLKKFNSELSLASENESEMEGGTAASATSLAKGEPCCEREDYKSCVARQKKRIEDRLRAAVAQRTAMGDYIVPEEGKPLARNFGTPTPGPGDYSPDINAVKRGPVGVVLTSRWSKSTYDTPGPGPAGYFPDCPKCPAAPFVVRHKSERFGKSETLGPGPDYDVSSGIGMDKPQALILSRPALANGTNKVGGQLVNIFGFNRFGKSNPPKAILIGKRKDNQKDNNNKDCPSFNSPKDNDTRLGITIKSRIEPLKLDESPGYLALPPLLGEGPGVSLGIRKFPKINDDSPGPIYKPMAPEPKQLTLTFKPFPSTRAEEEEPSPIHYGPAPGNQSIKNKPCAPRAVLVGTHDLNLGADDSPAPNKYRIRKNSTKLGITLKGRRQTKEEVTPGPEHLLTTAHLHRSPTAVIQGKWKEKKLVERSPGFVYDVVDCSCGGSKVVGGLMSSRWSEREDKEDDEGEGGPPLYNIYGMTNRGKCRKIPISLKSRHSPFVYNGIKNVKQVTKILKENCI